jgi:hypothetical protein
MITGNECAFSAPDTICSDGLRTTPLQEGMTLRQYYAGLAMVAIRTSSKTEESALMAKYAVEDADALIAELNKTV